MPEITIFLDFDDTISDSFQFNTQYVRAIGAVMAPRYGGDVESWAKSAIDMLQVIEEDYVARFGDAPLAGYCDWLASIQSRCTELLFGGMSLPVPPDLAGMAPATQFQALTACDATYPRAREALASLDRSGHRIHMASGQESEYLRGALIGAGLDGYIGRKFGPDLIDCAKEGPEFYAKIFATAGVAPTHAIVVDDRPEMLSWAMELGAAAIQAKLSRERHFDVVPGIAAVLSDLADLPGLVERAFSGG